jgi:hypothetical protein
VTLARLEQPDRLERLAQQAQPEQQALQVLMDLTVQPRLLPLER